MNTLPKIDQPLFELECPSKGKKFLARPYTVKEEKILLTAQQSRSQKDIVLALMQILTNVINDESFDPSSLTIYDLEFMFLKLRSQSVGNIIELTYHDPVDDKDIKFTVDLNDVTMREDRNDNNKIMITDTIGVILKHPSVKLVEAVEEDISELEVVDTIIINCIEQMFDEDRVYEMAEVSAQDRKDWLEQLPLVAYQKINDWFDNLPSLYYKIEYENSQGVQTIELKTLDDFFTWR